MILITGLDSIIESLYLKDDLTSNSKKANILVNPVGSYVIGKTIIINLKGYSSSRITELLDNKNTVICRFDTDDDRVIVDPYELRMNESIMPLGMKINLINEEIYDKVNHIYDSDNRILYYPKPIKCMDYHVDGKLTLLGYLAYQLGYSIDDVSDTKFNHLDVIKMKNGIII
jgi:hypothetical protein